MMISKDNTRRWNWFCNRNKVRPIGVPVVVVGTKYDQYEEFET